MYHPQPTDRDLSVLHVDDQPALTELVKAYLEQIDPDFTILEAHNATAALQLLEAESIDCIVSDYEMPEMNGISFLETVRSRGIEIPFFLYTGKGSEEIASEAISAGVSEYMQKSSGIDHYELLAQRIRTQVEKHWSDEHITQTYEALDAIDQGFSILGADGTFLYVNSAYASLLGYEPSELIGEHWELLFHPADIDTVREEVIENAVSTGVWDGQTRELRNDGSEIMLDHKLQFTSGGLMVCIIENPTAVNGTEPPAQQRA